MKHLGNVIGHFSQFRNDNSLGGLETVWPETHSKAQVNDPDKEFQNEFINAKAFNVGPCNVIQARCQLAQTAGKCLI